MLFANANQKSITVAREQYPGRNNLVEYLHSQSANDLSKQRPGTASNFELKNMPEYSQTIEQESNYEDDASRNLVTPAHGIN